MIPTGGFSVIVHLLINAVASIGRFFHVHPYHVRIVPSLLILGIVWMAILISGLSMLVYAIMGENNLNKLIFLLTTCEKTVPIEQTGMKRYVVLRIDDIQANIWTNIQRKMINDALAEGYHPVLGVIPINLRNDRRMYAYLRSVRCDVELALHGWDNKEPVPGKGEFSMLSKDEAYERLTDGIGEIMRLGKQQVTTFIPPNNEISKEAIQATFETDIKIISATGSGVYDYDATTFNFTTGTFMSAEETAQQCEETFLQEPLCIIMLHPQDYLSGNAYDAKKYAEYRTLLAYIKEHGYTVVRFRDLYVLE